MDEQLYALILKLTGEERYSRVLVRRIMEDAAVLERARQFTGVFTTAQLLPADANKVQGDQAARALTDAGWVVRDSTRDNRRIKEWSRVQISEDDRRRFRAWCMENRRHGFTTDEAMDAVFGRTDMRTWAIAEIRDLGLKSLITADGRRWRAPVLRPGDKGYEQNLERVLNNVANIFENFPGPPGKPFASNPTKDES